MCVHISKHINTRFLTHTHKHTHELFLFLVHTFPPTHTHSHTHTHKSKHTCTHAHTHTHTCTHTHTNTRAHTRALCLSLSLTNTNTHTHTHTQTHTHTHTHTHIGGEVAGERELMIQGTRQLCPNEAEAHPVVRDCQVCRVRECMLDIEGKIRQKRPSCIAKETYTTIPPFVTVRCVGVRMYLWYWQKNLARETNMYGKRDLFVPQKRPIWLSLRSWLSGV